MTDALDLPDGIYFGLPMDVYLAIRRLSGSGIQDLLVSPGTFWNRSWLNPRKAEQTAALALQTPVERVPAVARPFLDALRDLYPEAAAAAVNGDEDSTKAQQLGRAYHTARLEPHLLDALFARQPERADYPKDSLWTGPDIERVLAERDEPKKKAGEKVEDQARRLADLGYEGTIFPVIMADFRAALNGRTAIEGRKWDDMIEDAERLRASPEIADLLSGGEAEVTLLWTGPGGIRMKARLDYLKPTSWSDLKTFDNTRGIHLYQALTNYFRFNRLHVQAVVYREVVELIRHNALDIIGDATHEQRALIARIAVAPDDLDCWFVFQEKNGVPNIIGRKCRFFDVPLNVRIQHAGASEAGIARVEEATRTETMWHQRAKAEIRKARELFAGYQEVFRPGQPWLPVDAVGEFSDEDFNAGWLEGRD